MPFDSQLLTVSWMQELVGAHGWIWPVCEVIHYVGVSLVLGLIGALDLRILGMYKSVPIGALRPLVPLAIAGFVANLLTGIVFLTGSEAGSGFYLDNLSFHLKVLALVIAFANLMYFQYSELEERVYSVAAGGDAPASAKVVALVSIVSWVSVIIFGRLLMYNDALLYSLGL
jgi:hypothetical protein